MKKVALITGASRGIGKAIAYTFANEGYNLILTCLNNIDLLNQIKNDIKEQYHVSCTTYSLDMSDYKQVENMFMDICKYNEAIDVLINNAGISHIGLFSDMDEEQWDRIINVNLKSIFNTCKFTIPTMVNRQQGNIINISSVWGISGASCEVAYSASKSGIHGLTKALAKELAPSNIRVNAIACGAIDTDMNKWLTNEEREVLQEEIPMNRLGDAKEVANLCCYLAKGQSSYLTGQVIPLDGGWI